MWGIPRSPSSVVQCLHQKTSLLGSSNDLEVFIGCLNTTVSRKEQAGTILSPVYKMSAGNVFWPIASQCVRDVLCLTTKPGRTLAVLGTLHCSLLILFCSLGCMRWCGLAVSPFIALIGRGSRSVLVNTKAAVPMNVWELTSNSVLGEEELQQWQHQWMWFFHNTGEKSVKKGSSASAV